MMIQDIPAPIEKKNFAVPFFPITFAETNQSEQIYEKFGFIKGK